MNAQLREILREIVSQYDPNLALDVASTIPSSWYINKDFYQLELETVFSQSWQLAARADQVTEPGRYVTTDVAGEPIVIVRGSDGGTGTALVEVYDLNRTANATLANISTRGAVGVESDVIIGGFIIFGNGGSTRVLIRSIGPSLATVGITNAMPDPTLELRDSNGTLIVANDNWRDGPQLEIQETTLAPTNDLESAVNITAYPSAPNSSSRRARKRASPRSRRASSSHASHECDPNTCAT